MVHRRTDRLCQAGLPAGSERGRLCRRPQRDILYRSAEDQNERLPALAAELVGSRCRGDCGDRGTISAICREGGDRDNSDCFHRGRRPGGGSDSSPASTRPGGNVTGIRIFWSTCWWRNDWSCCTSSFRRRVVIGMLVDPNNAKRGDRHQQCSCRRRRHRQATSRPEGRAANAMSRRPSQACWARKTDALFVGIPTPYSTAGAIS